MQPLQYDLRSPAAKDNSITHAAKAWSNLHAAITMRSAETELQNTIELRATASEIVAPERKKGDFEAFLKEFLEGKSLAPKWRKKAISCSTFSSCKRIFYAKSLAPKWRKSANKSISQPSSAATPKRFTQELQQNRILMPERKKGDFEAFS